jgi:hypothetical protein
MTSKVGSTRAVKPAANLSISTDEYMNCAVVNCSVDSFSLNYGRPGAAGRSISMKKTQRHKQIYPSFDRDKLGHAAKVSFDDRDLEHLSAVVALYMHDVAAEFKPQKSWDWSREAPLTREQEQKRRAWLVREVEKIWRKCGGTGRGAYYSDETGKHTGPLLELLEELLNQAGAPSKNRSSHSLFRAIQGRR